MRQLGLCATILLVFFLLFHPLSIKAKEINRSPISGKLTWIDATGEVTEMDWKTATEAGWTTRSKKLGLKIPVFRSFIEVPQEFEVLDMRTDGGKIERNVKTDLISDPSGEVFVIETLNSVTSVDLKVKTKAGKTLNYSVLIQLSVSEPALYENPDCQDQGIRIRSGKRKGKFVFLSTSCRFTEHFLDVIFYHSNDANWRSAQITNQFGKTLPAKRKNLQVLRFPLEKIEGKNLILAQVKLSDKNTGTPTFYRVYFLSSKKQKRFTMSAGLGATFLDYLETPIFSESLTQIALTAKANANYWLSPGVFDLGGNIFGNIISLTHSNDSVSSARFYGINFRVGYQLPFGSKYFRLKLNTGWYIWGMLTDGTYGIAQLFGPQVFLLANMRLFSKATYAYLKFAPVGQGSSISLSDHEKAAGFGFQVSSIRAKRMWFVTVDVSDLSFNFQDGLNVITFKSYSLGVSTSLF